MRKRIYLFNLVLLFGITGCGTTALNFKPTDDKVDLARYKSLTIETSTARDIAVSEPTQQRIKGLIKSEIIQCCKDRFENISVGDPGSQDMLLVVKFTIYEEGNRFARFMLAGLGAMQIHANVEIKDAESARLLSGGEAGKTFAWGGVVGATKGIEDLEEDFAKEVVQGLRKALGILPASDK